LKHGENFWRMLKTHNFIIIIFELAVCQIRNGAFSIFSIYCFVGP
jgi:hypothetical protein